MTITFPSTVSKETLNAILAIDRLAIVEVNGEVLVRDIPAFLMKDAK